MANNSADVIIVGQGLAGTTLAWHLMDKGHQVIIVDAATNGMASHAAAGLITPVTGKKLKDEPDFGHLLAVARSHYQTIEHKTQASFFSSRPALRLLDSETAKKSWAKNNQTLAHVHNKATAFANAQSSTVICMPDAFRLDVGAYLAASRQYFANQHCLIEALIAPEDIENTAEMLRIPKLALSGKTLVFCRGWRDQNNSWFPQVQWRLAKGQIIEIKSDTLPTQHTLHASGIWLTQHHDKTFLCGATYEWDHFDTGPDDAGATLLCEKLAGITDADFNVIGQRAGVRPILSGRQPVIGFSDKDARIALCNGLGSKGSLYAPLIAAQLSNALSGENAIESRFCLRKRFAT